MNTKTRKLGKEGWRLTTSLKINPQDQMGPHFIKGEWKWTFLGWYPLIRINTEFPFPFFKTQSTMLNLDILSTFSLLSPRNKKSRNEKQNKRQKIYQLSLRKEEITLLVKFILFQLINSFITIQRRRRKPFVSTFFITFCFHQIQNQELIWSLTKNNFYLFTFLLFLRHLQLNCEFNFKKLFLFILLSLSFYSALILIFCAHNFDGIDFISKPLKSHYNQYHNHLPPVRKKKEKVTKILIVLFKLAAILFKCAFLPSNSWM